MSVVEKDRTGVTIHRFTPLRITNVIVDVEELFFGDHPLNGLVDGKCLVSDLDFGRPAVIFRDQIK